MILILLIPTACQTVSRPEKASPEPIIPEEDEGEVIYITASPGTINLDPLHAFLSIEAQLYTAFYEGLVTYNPLTLEPLPAVAHRWEISDDKRTYRFYLRQDAYYNNGDPVLAEDFKNSWMRIIHPENKAEYSVFLDIIKGAANYRTGQNKDKESVGIRAVSSHVLEVELEEPASHFLKLLCHMTFVPVHPGYYSRKDWEQASSLVSNGPFNYFRQDEKRIILLRNNLYWGASQVKVREIRIDLLDNEETATDGFNNGFSQWALDFNYDMIKNKEHMIYFPMFSINFMFFRCGGTPWSDYRVRRGLSLLMPWEKIRSESPLFYTETLIPEIDGYPVQEGINTDEKEGMALLEEAGYPGGAGLPPLVLKTTRGGDSESPAFVIKKILEEKLSLEVTIIPLHFKGYYDELKKDDYTIGFMSWIGDYPDPLSFLQLWTSDSNLNDAQFKHDEYDRLITEALGKQDEEKYILLGEAEGILLYEAAILPIRRHPSLNLINVDALDGWYPNILDIHPFKYLRFREHELLPGIVMAR